MTATEFDLFEIMRTTRSMRRLKPDPVPSALLNKILEFGTFAASGGNMQSWRFLVIRDPTIKEFRRSVVSEGMARGGGATLPIKQTCAGCDARGLRPDVGGG